MAKQGWQNRITGQGEEDADQLLANPRNFRLHPKHQQDALEGVLNEVGWVDDVIVNQRTGFVIDGHLRVSLAQRRGEKVPVKYVDLTDSEEALILATFDPISALAIADKEHLDHLLREVTTSDAAVMQMLADLAEQEGVVSFNDEPEGLTDPDAVPEPPADPITKPGDLWTLGRHRLLCGDSTYKVQLDRLMQGDKADMVFTDPPYGVNVSGKGGSAIHGDLTASAIFLMFDALPRVMAEGAWLYVCGGSSNAAQYHRMFEHHFQQIPGMIIWDKGKTAVMRHNGYHSCYEVVYFSYKVGGGARWYSERTSDHADDIWRVPLDPDRVHPTQKPVELPARAIRNSCPPEGIVFEPFGGSGSTLIACEQTGRSCRSVELDPKYCDAIVQRWENFTGQTATREAAS